MRISSISLSPNILLMPILGLTVMRGHNLLGDVYVGFLIATAVMRNALEKTDEV